jgi:hypothetical protein
MSSGSAWHWLGADGEGLPCNYYLMVVLDEDEEGTLMVPDEDEDEEGTLMVPDEEGTLVVLDEEGTLMEEFI